MDELLISKGLPALTPEEEAGVLNFDPWGDRDATYRTLRSGFARCRKSYQCAICFGPIAVGERVWAKTEQDDGTVATFRFCAECCWCIARRYDTTDDDDGYDLGFTRLYERWDIGRQRADDERAQVAKAGEAPAVYTSNAVNERKA